MAPVSGLAGQGITQPPSSPVSRFISLQDTRRFPASVTKRFDYPLPLAGVRVCAGVLIRGNSLKPIYPGLK